MVDDVDDGWADLAAGLRYSIYRGSNDVAGNDIVIGAMGAKYKPHCQMEIGVAWEFPLTDRRDVLENRFTTDLILR